MRCACVCVSVCARTLWLCSDSHGTVDAGQSPEKKCYLIIPRISILQAAFPSADWPIFHLLISLPFFQSPPLIVSRRKRAGSASRRGERRGHEARKGEWWWGRGWWWWWWLKMILNVWSFMIRVLVNVVMAALKRIASLRWFGECNIGSDFGDNDMTEIRKLCSNDKSCNDDDYGVAIIILIIKPITLPKTV